jgi:integrase
MGDLVMTADPKFLSDQKLEPLNYKQKILFIEEWNEFIYYVREKGKDPRKQIGYADPNVRPTARRVFQFFEYVWSGSQSLCLKLTTEQADNFLIALMEDDVRTKNGDPYAAGSKRKFVDALRTYYRYQDCDWDPNITFEDKESNKGSDPLRRQERDQILSASLNYKTPPSYSNLSPEERDRWKSYIAQHIGKPKENVEPADWQQLQRSWKIPALISTTLDAGWRAAMVERLLDSHADLDNGIITIPPEVAVKNNKHWENELSDRSVTILTKWLEQRKNKSKYDNDRHIWLNRKGNPYNSKNLNNLFRSLIEESQIEPGCRKLTWHSLRHSLGRYIYAQTEDLGYVAEILRHKSLEAARRYAHPSPEAKRSIIESLQ